MGVDNLMKYCTNVHNRGTVLQTVNLVQAARQTKGIELLVNCHRFQTFIGAKLWKSLASQSNNDYLKILGGEHYSFHSYVKKLIEDLKSVRISLVFVVDGDTQKVSEEKLKGTAQIDDIIKICDGTKSITELGTNHPRSPLQRVQFEETLKQCGCEIITVLAREINYEIAKTLQQRPDAYVLCNDSDFCVFKNCRFIHYTLFDVDNDLQLNKPIDERAQPTKIMAEVMTTKSVMAAFRIKDFSLLVEMSIVAGNDFTSPYMLRGLKDKINLKGRRGLGSIAGLVKFCKTVETIREIRQEMETNHMFSEAVIHSRHYFSLTLPSSKLNKNSILTKMIENGIIAGKFPHYVMGFHNNIYCHRLLVEKNEPGQPGSEVAMEHLRAQIYRIVLQRGDTVVKEYGRCTSESFMFEVDAVEDENIPTLENINEKDDVMNRKLFHYVMTHMERGMAVTLVKGKIELENVDALACAIDSNLNLAGSGSAAKSLLAAGGKSLLAECKGITNVDRYTQVITIKAGNLKCQQVYLTILPDEVEDKYEHKKSKDTSSDMEKVLYNRISQVLKKAIEDGMTSIALPALGTGKLNHTAETVARLMFDCVRKNRLTNGSLCDVKFVLYDRSTFEAFEKVSKEEKYKELKSDETKKIWFEEFDAKTAFKIYILRYFLLLNWNRNLQLTEKEFTALMALVIRKRNAESYYQAICLRPNIRCLTLGSWFQNVYKHAYKYLGKLLYLSHELPAPHEVFCGSAWTAYYTSYCLKKELRNQIDCSEDMDDLLETNTNEQEERRTLFLDLNDEITSVIKDKKEIVKRIIRNAFNLDQLFH